MPQGSSALRPTNGLYLYLLPNVTQESHTWATLKTVAWVNIVTVNVKKIM